MDRLANYVKINEKGRLNPARPPNDVVADILALTNLPLPMLEAIVKTPVFSAAGDLEVRPGYQPSTAYYLNLSNGLTIPKVPSNPTADDIKKAEEISDARVRPDPIVGSFANPKQVQISREYVVYIDKLEAGKKRLARDSVCDATRQEIQPLKRENDELKQLVAGLSLEAYRLKKTAIPMPQGVVGTNG